MNKLYFRLLVILSSIYFSAACLPDPPDIECLPCPCGSAEDFKCYALNKQRSICILKTDPKASIKKCLQREESPFTKEPSTQEKISQEKPKKVIEKTKEKVTAKITEKRRDISDAGTPELRPEQIKEKKSQGKPCEEGKTRVCTTSASKLDCYDGTQRCNSAQEWEECDKDKEPKEVCDNHDNNCDGRVDEGCVTTFAGSGAPLVFDGSGEEGTLYKPRHLVITKDENTIYFTEPHHHLIRMLKKSSGKWHVTTIAGNKQAGFVDDDGKKSSFDFPNGITLGPNEKYLYVCDYKNKSIRKINLKPPYKVTTFVKSVPSKFGHPISIVWSDRKKVFYMLDFTGSNIQKIDINGQIKKLVGEAPKPKDSRPCLTKLKDGTSTEARICSPTAMAYDAKNNRIIIVDAVGLAVRLITLDNSPKVETIGLLKKDLLYPKAAPLKTKVLSVAVHSNGEIYLGQFSQITRLTYNNKQWGLSLVQGNQVTGFKDGVKAKLYGPYDLTFGKANRLFFSDTENNRIRQLDLSLGAKASTLFGNAGSPALRSDSGGRKKLSEQGAFSRASEILYREQDGKKYIYFADTENYQIRRISLPSGKMERHIGGDSSKDEEKGRKQGDKDGSGINALLSIPAALASYKDNVYVFDAGKIKKILAAKIGAYAGQLPGYANGELSRSRFRDTRAMAFDNKGALYLADSGNHCIRKIEKGMTNTILGPSPISEKPTAFTKPGLVDGIGSDTRFFKPKGIAVLTDGKTIYVADTGNHVIRILTQKSPTTYEAKFFAGTIIKDNNRAYKGVCGWSDGLLKKAKLCGPTSIKISPDKMYLYIADTKNHCIRRIRLKDKKGAIPHSQMKLETYAGTTTKVFPRYLDGPRKEALFDTPISLTFQHIPSTKSKPAHTYLYVLDRLNYRIRRILLDH